MPSASTGSESFPCRRSTWPSRSFAWVRGSTSVVSPETGPARTRKQLMRPVNGSAIVLKMKTACFASPNSIVVPFLRRRRDALDEEVEQRRRAEVLRRDAARDRIELVARHCRLERVGDRLGVELLALRGSAPISSSSVSTTASRSFSRCSCTRSAIESGIGCGPPSRPPEGSMYAHMWRRSTIARQLVLAADRKLDRDAAVGELLPRRLEHAEEVGALAVEHVDEDDARELLLLGALPDAGGVDLDAHHAAEHDDDALDDPQRRVRVGLEARVARRVDEVDLAVLPLEVAERAREGHAALLLVLVPVGDGRPLLDAAEPVRLSRLEEQRLDERASSRRRGGRRRRCCGSSWARWQASGTCPPRSLRPHRIPAASAGRSYSGSGGRRPTARCALRRRIAFVWSCETRDSVTPSTSPISRRVSSS